jgi:hypothetical protein
MGSKTGRISSRKTLAKTSKAAAEHLPKITKVFYKVLEKIIQ